MSLETISKLVAEHAPSSITPSPGKIDKARREQEIVQQMFKAIMVGMLILGVGLLMLVLNKNFDFGKWFGLASSFLLLGGTGYAAFAVLNAIRRGASLPLGAKLDALPEVTERSLPTKEFPQALPSVTERTTRLISNDAKRKSTDYTDYAD